MQKQHIFMEPFYYIDYALARFGSLEYNGHMMQDYQSAWEDYYHLCCAGGSRSYPELLKIGNLSSPLEEGTVKKLCRRKQILSGAFEDWKFKQSVRRGNRKENSGFDRRIYLSGKSISGICKK